MTVDSVLPASGVPAALADPEKEIVMRVIIQGLQRAFMERLAEWAFAAMIFGIGLSLMVPENLFERPAWALTRMILDQHALGLITTGIGVARLIALAVNGAWRPMYHFRALLAGVSTVIWFSLGIGFYGAGIMGIWLGIFPVLFIFDAVNMRRAIVDAVKADRAATAARRAEGAASNGS